MNSVECCKKEERKRCTFISYKVISENALMTSFVLPHPHSHRQLNIRNFYKKRIFKDTLCKKIHKKKYFMIVQIK